SAEARRGTSQVDDDIEDCSGEYPDQLSLDLAYLVVKSSQHVTLRDADILLHETCFDTGGREGALVPGFEEQAARVAIHGGLDHPRYGKGQRCASHQNTRSLMTRSRYSPYPDLPRLCARLLSCWRSMKPWRNAISSGQQTFRPCRASIVSTKFAAASSDAWVPVSSQATPRPRTWTRSAPLSR